MGGRSGVTLPGDNLTYWPFRLLTGKDEEDVLKMIEKENARPAE